MQIAALAFAQQADAENSYPQKPRQVLLRERLRTAAYTSDAEHLFSNDALSLEQELADRGDLDAIQRLAFRQLLGLGVEPNVNEAVRAFEGAAQAGDPNAMLNLGLLHTQGINGVTNHTRAKELFLAASQANLAAAWNGLGHLYLNGLGVDVNATLATCALPPSLLPYLPYLSGCGAAAVLAVMRCCRDVPYSAVQLGTVIWMRGPGAVRGAR